MATLSSTKIVEMLSRSADTISEQVQKIASLEAVVESMRREKRAESLLDTMEARGVAGRIEGSTRQEKVASLSNRNLDVVEEALDLHPDNGGLFETTDRPAPGGVSAAEGRLLSELLSTAN